jgi:hypothetical protein
MIGGWRRLEPNNIHTSPNMFRVIKLRGMKWTGHIARTGGMRTSYKLFMAKPEGKRPLRRRRSRWEANMRMNLREIG